jgi:hypothetical protein
LPFDTTLIPESEETVEVWAFLFFKDFNKADLSAGVISSDPDLCDKPAFCILSNKADSEIFNVLAKFLTVKAKINTPIN